MNSIDNVDTYNLSNFYYGAGDDIHTLAETFDEWYKQALHRGYNNYEMPLTTAPNSVIRINHPDTKKEIELINLSSYNYLGISTRTEVLNAAKDALDEYGFGASGSPVLSGTYQIYKDFANEIAAFKNKEKALIFPTGYSANLGFISSILRPGDHVIMDQYAHASIVDGAILSRAKISYFKHNNPEHLEKKLSRLSGKKLVVVEGVYSMDGDICCLDEIVQVAKKHGARILLDEAHSAFIFGENGRGIAELYNLEDEIDFHMGTFSKSLGGIGGYVCGSKKMINYSRAYARSRFFSCALPPSVTAGLRESLKIAISEPQLRVKLKENYTLMKQKLAAYGIDTSSSQSQIVPIIIGNEAKTFKIAQKIIDKGVFVLPIVYPAVSINKGRLRISISATLTNSQIEYAAETIASTIKQYL